MGALLAVVALAAGCSAPVSTGGPADAGSTSAATVTSTTAPTVATLATTAPPASTAPTPAPTLATGAEVLAAEGFDRLRGMRVGVIANHTSRVDGERLVDVLDRADDVELAAIFAPEHGVTGLADAGEVLDDGTDAATGVPVHSLYGAIRQPAPEMLADVDVVVYDLQDVGTRFYTYISTMGLAMQSAAAAGIPFVVLDRPDPLGGATVGGFTRDAEWESFVGLYPVPAAYGMTAGELALAIRGEGWLPGLDGLDLDVVELAGWRRGEMWPETGRAWVPPSPGLPTFTSALVYPGTVLFEATSLNYGTGTLFPFTTVGAPWIDADALAADLNARGLPGVRFDPVAYTPEVNAMSSRPRLRGQALTGVRYDVTDPSAFRPVAAGVHVLEAVLRQADALGVPDVVDRPSALDRLAGTSRLRRRLLAGDGAAEIAADWSVEVDGFLARRAPYLLYE